MPNNELQPCPKYVYTFRTRFDKDIAQKTENPQNTGTKYRRFVAIRKIWRLPVVAYVVHNLQIHILLNF